MSIDETGKDFYNVSLDNTMRENDAIVSIIPLVYDNKLSNTDCLLLPAKLYLKEQAVQVLCQFFVNCDSVLLRRVYKKIISLQREE